jgi:hypothetical protein
MVCATYDDRYETLMCTPAISPRVGPVLTSLLHACMDKAPARRPSAAAVVVKLRLAAQAHDIDLPCDPAL